MQLGHKSRDEEDRPLRLTRSLIRHVTEETSHSRATTEPYSEGYDGSVGDKAEDPAGVDGQDVSGASGCIVVSVYFDPQANNRGCFIGPLRDANGKRIAEIKSTEHKTDFSTGFMAAKFGRHGWITTSVPILNFQNEHEIIEDESEMPGFKDMGDGRKKETVDEGEGQSFEGEGEDGFWKVLRNS